MNYAYYSYHPDASISSNHVVHEVEFKAALPSSVQGKTWDELLRNEQKQIIDIKESIYRYSQALDEIDKGKDLEGKKRYWEALTTFKAAFNTLNEVVGYRDSIDNTNWCSKKIKELEDITNATLTIVISNSCSPFAQASGSQYVYRFHKRGDSSYQYSEKTIDLIKGTNVCEIKLNPGSYEIGLIVFDKDGVLQHRADCSVDIAPMENLRIISNKPGLFSHLKLFAEKVE